MKTERLIEQLSSGLTPVRRGVSVARFTVFAMFISLIFICVGLFVFQVRADAATKIAEPTYVIDLLFPLGLMVTAISCSARMSIPGEKTQVSGTFLILLTMFVAFEAYRIFQGLPRTANVAHFAGLGCASLVLVLGFFLASSLSFLTSRCAPTKPVNVGLMIAISAVAAGQLAIALHCPVDDAIHIAIWHIAVPTAVAATAGTFVLSRLLRW